MANKIQFKRGLKTNIPTLSIGEPALCTDTEEIYIGSSSSNIQLAKLNDVKRQVINIDKFRTLFGYDTKDSVIVIGDSISEGSNSLDFQNDSYVGIIRKALNIDNGNKNFGFESFGVNPVNNKYHSLSSFNMNLELNPDYYGGNVVRSSINGAYLIIDYIGKDCKLVYASQVGGGILDVKIDGVSWGTIDTSVVGAYPNGEISLPIVGDKWGAHQVIFQKIDTKPTDICGMMYFEDVNSSKTVLHNVSRSGIYASQIPDILFDQYTNSGMVILALGVNDQLQSANINTFKAKIEYIASRVFAKKGTMIIVDFMYNSPQSSLYKQVLMDTAIKYPNFDYIDFAQIWFGSQSINIASGLLDTDGLHPSVSGHEQISQVMLKHMNLPYAKNTVKYVPDNDYVQLTFNNGWTEFGGVGDTPSYKLNTNGRVYLRGILKPGTLSVGIVMATLPKGRIPKSLKVLSTSANGLPTEIKINTDGTIVLSGTNGAGFLTLDNLSFELD